MSEDYDKRNSANSNQDDEDLWEPEGNVGFFQSEKHTQKLSPNREEESREETVEQKEDLPFIPDIPDLTDVFGGKAFDPQPRGSISDLQSGSNPDPSQERSQDHSEEKVWNYKEEKKRVKASRRRYKDECRKLKKEANRRGPGWKKVVVTGMCSGVTGGILACVVTIGVLTVSIRLLGVDLLKLKPDKIVERYFTGEIKPYASPEEAVLAKAGDSIVSVKVNKGVEETNAIWSAQRGALEKASGVIYRKDGYIITTLKAIPPSLQSGQGSDVKIEVYLRSNEKMGYEAKVVGFNKEVDLAVLKINETELPKVDLGTASDLAAGQQIFVIGCPNGNRYMGTIYGGNISAVKRQIPGTSETLQWIQTNVHTGTGSSGGALLDTKGKLVGIHFPDAAGEDLEDIGFAVPVDQVKEVCDTIIENNN